MYSSSQNLDAHMFESFFVTPYFRNQTVNPQHIDLVFFDKVTTSVDNLHEYGRELIGTLIN